MRDSVPNVDTTALRPDDPRKHISKNLGPHLVGHPHLEHPPGETIAVPVPHSLAKDPPDEVGDGRTVEADVEEPGPGDLDSGDAFGTRKIRTQHLGDPQRGLPGVPGELQGDAGRVVPPPAAPRRPDHGPRRNSHAELPVVDSTTHRAQHGPRQLDGSHGTSVWEEGGG